MSPSSEMRGGGVVVAGAGRFNLTWPYLAYQPVCNLLTTLCYLAVFALMLALPGFGEFFRSHEWVEFLKVGIVVSYYVAWEFMHDQCAKPLVGDPSTEICENPDNYLPSRAHVWANTLHLVWTISLVIVGMLSVLAYSVVRFRTTPAPVELAWPCAAGVLFFAYASISPYAVRTRATGIGVFLPAVVAICVVFAVLALVCFLPSVAGVALGVSCVACLAGAIAWTRRARGSDLSDWLGAWRHAGAYPAAIVCTILLLLAIVLVMFTRG